MTTIDKEIADRIKEQWSSLSEQVKKVILDEKYNTVVHESLAGTGSDEDTISTLSLNALLVLLDIQTIEGYHEILDKNQKLTTEQKESVKEKIDTDLFIPLSLHDKTPNTTQITACIEDSQQAQERYTKLPESVQQTISSKETGDALTKIAKDSGLNENQEADLNSNISQVLVGIKTSKDFKENYIKSLGLDPKKTEVMLADIENKIILPVRENLLKALEDKKREEGEVAPTGKITSKTDPYREQT